MIQNMTFLYVPALKKDLQSFEVALNYINCLTREDVRDLLLLLKQINWTEGIEAALKSKSV